MGLRNTRAVVSRTMRMSNSSKLVTLITEKHGLVKVVARGARRPTSKFGAALEPVTLIDCIYYYKDNRELQTISSTDLIDDYAGLKDDLIRLTTASAILEMTQRFTPEGDTAAGTFGLLTASLKSLEKARQHDVEKHLWRFVLRLLTTAGYRPVLDKCIRCGNDIRGSHVFFSYADGGVVCSCTGNEGLYGFKVSAGALRMMQSLGTALDKDLPSLKMVQSQKREVEQAVLQFLAYQTGSSRLPRSLVFLKNLEHTRQ